MTPVRDTLSPLHMIECATALQSVFLENAETVFAPSSSSTSLVGYLVLAASAEDTDHPSYFHSWLI